MAKRKKDAKGPSKADLQFEVDNLRSQLEIVRDDLETILSDIKIELGDDDEAESGDVDK